MDDVIKKEIIKLNTRILGESFMSRLERIPTKLNEFGYDEFGFKPEVIKYIVPIFYFLCKIYWRVEAFGLQNIPKSGRVLLVCNHAGQLPWDGSVVICTIFNEMEPPRMARSMIEKWTTTLPFMGEWMSLAGQIVGTPENCQRLLENDEAILVFPEGTRGINKLFKDRYHLQDFGHGFMRLALKTNTPIIPIASIGSEESCPAIFNIKWLAKLLGAPAAPITPTFPLLGPLGILPYPVKYRLYFGEPMHFTGDPDEDDVEIDLKVQTVRNTIQSMIYDGLHARKHVFW